MPVTSQKTSYKGTKAKPKANINGTATTNLINVFFASFFINQP